VGAGITGVMTAYLLAQRGKRVALLELHDIAAATPATLPPTRPCWWTRATTPCVKRHLALNTWRHGDVLGARFGCALFESAVDSSRFV
jgi:glycine/D-amino acid oxidase-like deaminating enzyme